MRTSSCVPVEFTDRPPREHEIVRICYLSDTVPRRVQSLLTASDTTGNGRAATQQPSNGGIEL